MIPDTASTLDRSRPLAIGWAAFLGMSWTWCIGMYLPVLMVRDFGAAGWFVFMLPNVVGAAAMGWVLNRPGSAAKLAVKHRFAAVAFSIVTILFHAFFVGWIIRSLTGDVAEVITLAAAAGFYFVGRRGRRDLFIAAGLFVISLTAFIVAASMPEVHPVGPIATKSMLGLVYLAPVCVFGFFLCPYLDLTFLRARAATETKTGIAAFTFGFGMFFLVMLLFTLWYARLIQPGNLHSIPRTLAWVIAGHMMFQAAFTMALHMRAISESIAPSPAASGEFWPCSPATETHLDPLPAYRENGAQPAGNSAGVGALALAMACVFLIGRFGDSILPSRFNGEIIYRLFMSFYGLIFPAYVWLCMIQTRGNCDASRRQKLVVLAVAILIAAPMFWMGFIGDRMIWLVPGLFVVLLSRAVLYVHKVSCSK